MLFVAALLVASVAASGDDALPQPEVEFDDGTTTPMILTKLASEKELVVTGCGLNAAPRLCGMSLGIEANMASGAANAADIAANTVLISGLQTSVDTLRTATLAEDKALRASSTALGIETAQLRKENALMRAALVSLTARLDTLDSKHDDDLKRLEELHAADVAALAVHNAASDAADKELGAAIVEVEKMQGPQGAKGEKGEKGEQGEKGAAATLPPTPPPTPPSTNAVLKPSFSKWDRSDKFLFWRNTGGADRMDFTMAPGYAWGQQNDGAVYDLGAASVSGEQWTLRFSLHLSKYAGGSRSQDSIGVGLTSSPTFNDVGACQSSMSWNVAAGTKNPGFYVQGSGQDSQYACGFSGSPSPYDPESSLFKTAPVAGQTVFAELRRDGAKVIGSLYPDATYTTPTETVSNTAGGNVSTLRYLAIKGLGQTAHGYAAGFNSLAGWIDDVRFGEGATPKL